MPLYEYLCKKCGQSFAFTMTVSEHEKKRVQCPHCNGTEIVPQSSRFSRRLPKKLTTGRVGVLSGASPVSVQNLPRVNFFPFLQAQGDRHRLA